MAIEKELNINLMERLHIINRIKAAAEEYSCPEEVMKVILREEKDILEMLYQDPPLSKGKE